MLIKVHYRAFVFEEWALEIRILRELYHEGLLKKASVVPAPMEQDRWLLVFERLNGAQENITRARTDQEKVYKRINGALVDAREIGFKSVTVEFQ